MKTSARTLCAVLAGALTLIGAAGCGILYPQSKEEPPVSKETGPLVGEFVTEGGSKLTFTDDGVSDYWDTGYVLVELADDAEYLLEGRENNKTYRYLFGIRNEPAPYDVADAFSLLDGAEKFAMCGSRYTALCDLLLDPYSPDGEELLFERVAVPSEGGTYDLVQKENGYFEVIKRED